MRLPPPPPWILIALPVLGSAAVDVVATFTSWSVFAVVYGVIVLTLVVGHFAGYYARLSGE